MSFVIFASRGGAEAAYAQPFPFELLQAGDGGIADLDPFQILPVYWIEGQKQPYPYQGRDIVAGLHLLALDQSGLSLEISGASSPSLSPWLP